MDMLKSSKEELASAFEKGNIVFCVIGPGRIGLPTAVVFAKAGGKVFGVDIDVEVVKEINSGKSRFEDEPGLNGFVRDLVNKGKLKATLEASSAVANSDVVIVCVPTPVDESKTPDYSAIISTCKSIAKTLKKGSLVIIESTIGPDTAESLVIPILENETEMKAGRDFGVAVCPERADPGHILQDLETVPRIVGGIDKRSSEVAATVYEIALGVKTIKVSSPKTASTVKLTENIFRDVNIALINEMAVLYEKLGIDVIEVINACATKWNFLPHYPGAGVGGPCLPANPYYLIDDGIKVGYIPLLVRMAREINDRMPEHVVTLIMEALNEINKTVSGSKIAILGISYKPKVRDVQLTPIKKIYERLKIMGASIAIYDPLFKGDPVFGTKVKESVEEAVSEADLILFGTAHKEFIDMDLAKVAEMSRMPAALVDTRHVMMPAKAKENGFAYRGVGRIAGSRSDINTK